jgi:hypothetical protein
MTTALGVLLAHERPVHVLERRSLSELSVWPIVKSQASGQLPLYTGLSGDRRLGRLRDRPEVGWKIWVIQDRAEIEADLIATYRRLPGLDAGRAPRDAGPGNPRRQPGIQSDRGAPQDRQRRRVRRDTEGPPGRPARDRGAGPGVRGDARESSTASSAGPSSSWPLRRRRGRADPALARRVRRRPGLRTRPLRTSLASRGRRAAARRARPTSVPGPRAGRSRRGPRDPRRGR